MVDTEKLLREIRRKPSGCYVLAGGDSFLKEEFLKEVRGLLPAMLAELNFEVYTAGDVPASGITAAALSYPFGADFRIIVLKECSRLKPEDHEVLLAYLENPSEQTIMFLDFDRLPQSRGFFKKLNAIGRIISFNTKKRVETEEWLRQRAAGSGKKLSREAAAALGAAGGDNLRLLANEIDRLCLQAGERNEVTAEDAAFSAGMPRGKTGFDFADAVGKGNCAEALRLLSDIFKETPAPELLIGTLAWHFRAVWKVRAALEEGTPRGKLASACGVPPFRTREFIRMGGLHSDGSLSRIFRELLSADINAKTRQSGKLDMELLTVRLCSLCSA